MDLSIIISISGKPGLYKVVGRSRNGLIAESLADQKRIPVRTADKVSALSDISIFTYEDDLPLKEVLVKLLDHFEGKNSPDKLDDEQWMSEELRKVVPEYDEERVYASDLRKLFRWYNLLNEKGLIDKEEEPAEDPKEKKESKAKTKDTSASKAKKPATAKPASTGKPIAKKAPKPKSTGSKG